MPENAAILGADDIMTMKVDSLHGSDVEAYV